MLFVFFSDFKRYNLSKYKRNILKQIQNRSDIVFFNTDKNAGPAAMSRKDYIKKYFSPI